VQYRDVAGSARATDLTGGDVNISGRDARAELVGWERSVGETLGAEIAPGAAEQAAERARSRIGDVARGTINETPRVVSRPGSRVSSPQVERIEAASREELDGLLRDAQRQIVEAGRAIISTAHKRETRYVAYITHE